MKQTWAKIKIGSTRADATFSVFRKYNLCLANTAHEAMFEAGDATKLDLFPDLQSHI